MLESDSLRLNHARPAHPAFELDPYGKPVPTFPDHALALHKVDVLDRDQDRPDGQIVAEPDGHDTPCPGRTFTISIAVALVRATCSATFWRLTFGRCRSVSTIAPIIATSRTNPAAWK